MGHKCPSYLFLLFIALQNSLKKYYKRVFSVLVIKVYFYIRL